MTHETASDLERLPGAGDRDRTDMTSLEDRSGDPALTWASRTSDDETADPPSVTALAPDSPIDRARIGHAPGGIRLCLLAKAFEPIARTGWR